MAKKEEIIRVSTYARRNNMSTQNVYKLIKEGKLEKVVIDGMTFVKSK